MSSHRDTTATTPDTIAFQKGDRVLVRRRRRSSWLLDFFSLSKEEWDLGVVWQHQHRGNDDECVLVCLDDSFQEVSVVPHDLQLIQGAAEWTKSVFVQQYCQCAVANNQLTRMTLSDAYEWNGNLYNFILNDELAQHLEEALRQNESIQGIHLGARAIEHVGCKTLGCLMQAVATLPNLKQFSLMELTSEEPLEVIATRLVGVPLEELHWWDCCLPVASTIRGLLLQNHTLVELDIIRPTFNNNTKNWTEDLLSFFATEIHECTSLRSLKLSECPADFVESCLLGLSQHSTIEKVSIHDTLTPTRTYIQVELSAALQGLLATRRHQTIELTWWNNPVAPASFIAILARHCNGLESLSINRDTSIDDTVAVGLQSLLQNSTTLRGLHLPTSPADWSSCGPEGYARILEGLSHNRSLRDLSIATNHPEKVLSLIQTQDSWESLRLANIYSSAQGPFDLSILRYSQTLRHLTLDNMALNLQSVRIGMRENLGLVSGNFCCEDAVARQYLRRNQWLLQHSDDVQKTADSLWPYILARVSSNPSALYHMIRGRARLLDPSLCLTNTSPSTGLRQGSW